MTKEQIIRAWKDESYRSSLTPGQIAELPHNPAGMVELAAEELGAAAGGSTEQLASFGCCRTGLFSWLLTCSAGCESTELNPNPTFSYACK